MKITMPRILPRKASVLLYRKPRHTDQYLHYSFHHQTSCKEIAVSSLFNRTYSIITNKDDLYKKKLSNKASVKGEQISGKHY